MEIRKGTEKDVKEIALLYDSLNDYLERHVNYPGWKKGVYPIREDAYYLVDWNNNFDYDDVWVIYTFAIHPDYLQRGIGRKLLEFVCHHALETGMKALRLDVYEKNTPAIKLYESMGFQYIGTIDLGYSNYRLDSFKLYQKIV